MAKGPDRWSAVERVYHEALARPPERRAAFVAEVCAGNAELRREVESLLAQDAAADPLFTRGAAIGAARFEREARVLASVTHPNIALIHGVEEARSIRALVMELVCSCVEYSSFPSQ
jgi:hypothetical protein